MKKFLLNDKQIEKNSFIWNMAGSMIMAFQSVIMLMILTRTVGLVESGIFTIAYASANLFLTIGKYGMRNFQVSDVSKKFSFSEYKASRVISSVAMLIVSIGYVVFASITNGYSLNKSLVILFMCIFKIPDVIEDVYYGEYQKNGRLDIAAKAMTVRMCLTIVLFGILVVISRDLLVSLIVSTVFTFIIMWYLLRVTVGEFDTNKKIEKNNVVSIMKECFPLFAGSFLSFYIGNAPKYAIDSMLSDEIQACYGFIAMPVFVIGLLNNFIFNPMLYKISVMWNEGNIKAFVKRVFLQIACIIVITLICVLGAYLVGIPVLSLIYNTDLKAYKLELIILLLGGGALSLSGLLNIIITIMRNQKFLLWGYLIVAFFALVFSNFFVEKYAVWGAAVLYAVLMTALCACFIVIFLLGIKKNKNKIRIEE